MTYVSRKKEHLRDELQDKITLVFLTFSLSLSPSLFFLSFLASRSDCRLGNNLSQIEQTVSRVRYVSLLIVEEKKEQEEEKEEEEQEVEGGRAEEMKK